MAGRNYILLGAGMTTQNVKIIRDLDYQLLQSQKMEFISTLASGVAHNFNNILTIIIGACTLLEMKPVCSSDQALYISRIRSAAERAANLTQSLLAFSSNQAIYKRSEDLSQIVRNMQTFLGRIIGENIRLSTEFTGKPVIVLVDRGQIELVLMNLAANSRDAMPHGGNLRMTLSIELFTADVLEQERFRTGYYAVITVTDTGEGMDKESQQRIFEPFFTTKEPGMGTGLGLSMVYGIIRQHNGEMRVQSEPGEGTIFSIYLPLCDQSFQGEGLLSS
jgi:signal transduction histidine kinase